jgi:hypothetical protein
MPTIALPVDARAEVSFRPYKARTPIFALAVGQVLVSLTLPDRLHAEHVEFARHLAEHAAAYAIEVERIFVSGVSRPVNRTNSKEVA